MIHKYGFTDLTPEQRKALLLAESEHMAMLAAAAALERLDPPRDE